MQDEQDPHHELINNIGFGYYNNNVILIHEIPLNYEQPYIYNEILNVVANEPVANVDAPPPQEEKKIW